VNWPDIVGDLAYWFHFGPSEIDKFDIRDVIFWHNQMTRQLRAGAICR
jgi:hypothetical protein